jgi:hypothetical protein
MQAGISAIMDMAVSDNFILSISSSEFVDLFT